MRGKLAGLFVVSAAVLVVLLGRVTYINAVDGEKYTKAVLAKSQNAYSQKTLAYKRGDILDTNGNVLATSVKKYNVILDCSAVNADSEYVNPTVNALVKYFGVDEGKVRTLLADAKTANSKYQVLKKKISIETKKKYDAYRYGTDEHPLTKDETMRRHKVQGISFEEVYVRQYPRNTLASGVLGFTYDGSSADWGIESYYNNYLSGTDGRQYGYWGSDAEITQTIVDPVNGDSVRSTIDANIQEIVEKYIALYEKTYRKGPNSTTQGAKNVGVVVMNPNDGSILAMADSTPYDPNKPRDLSRYYTRAEIKAMTNAQEVTNLEKIWKNFCISDSYEPGSVFKPVTMSSALESGAVKSTDTFVCDGYQDVDGVRIRCSKTDGHGRETLSDAISNSCNDVLMQVGAKLGIDRFSSYQKMFGFGERTGIDLSGEATGIIGDADTMGDVDLATASFGQGFTCTMIQEASAVASVINGGNYYRPHVVSRITNESGATVRSFDKVLMKQTVSKDVSDLLRSYMKASVDKGTSMYSKVDGYSSGGKTGTAQKIPRGNGKYLVSWIGFAPYRNPKVLIYVVVDEPNVKNEDDNRYPQWIARDILSEVLPYLNVAKDEKHDANNWHLRLDLTNPDGQAVADTTTDTNVPEVQGTEKASDTKGGNTAETDGYTNEEAQTAQ